MVAHRRRPLSNVERGRGGKADSAAAPSLSESDTSFSVSVTFLSLAVGPYFLSISHGPSKTESKFFFFLVVNEWDKLQAFILPMVVK